VGDDLKWKTKSKKSDENYFIIYTTYCTYSFCMVGLVHSNIDHWSVGFKVEISVLGKKKVKFLNGNIHSFRKTFPMFFLFVNDI